MQIDGNYNSNYHSYSGTGHNYATHTHHFTECLHEEQIPKKKEGRMEASDGVTLEIRGTVKAEDAENGLSQMQAEPVSGFSKNGVGFFKGIWDAMGEPDGQNKDTAAVYEREDISFGKRVLQGVNAMVSAIRQGFTLQIAGRLEIVREKLKVGIHTALKRFGKDGENYGALTDPGTGSRLGGKAGGGAGKNKDSSGTRQENNEVIKTARMQNEHLMDSYSKSGTYCKINENLTYQQGRAPYKVSDRTEQPK